MLSSSSVNSLMNTWPLQWKVKVLETLFPTGCTSLQTTGWAWVNWNTTEALEDSIVWKQCISRQPNKNFKMCPMKLPICQSHDPPFSWVDIEIFALSVGEFNYCNQAAMCGLNENQPLCLNYSEVWSKLKSPGGDNCIVCLWVKWKSGWQRVTWAKMFTERFESITKSAVKGTQDRSTADVDPAG